MTSFESLTVTTATLVISLIGMVQRRTAFQLLPITPVPEARPGQLPFVDRPGSIISMQRKREVRGVVLGDPSRYFKNCINIYITTRRKTINLKLSATTVHMCGMNSKDDGLEATSYLLEHLMTLRDRCARLYQSPSLTTELMVWIMVHSQGEMVLVRSYPSNSSLPSLRIDNLIKSALPAAGYDPVVVDFLLSLAGEFNLHSQFCRKMRCLPKLARFLTPPLDVLRVDEVMVNYNYNLDFPINRARLHELIDAGDVFYSRYDNAVVNSVTIELPYQPDQGSVVKIRRDRVPHHSFLIYRSGAVTQSGPNRETMREVYVLFMRTINELRPLIELK